MDAELRDSITNIIDRLRLIDDRIKLLNERVEANHQHVIGQLKINRDYFREKIELECRRGGQPIAGEDIKPGPVVFGEDGKIYQATTREASDGGPT